MMLNKDRKQETSNQNKTNKETMLLQETKGRNLLITKNEYKHRKKSELTRVAEWGQRKRRRRRSSDTSRTRWWENGERNNKNTHTHFNTHKLPNFRRTSGNPPAVDILPVLPFWVLSRRRQKIKTKRISNHKQQEKQWGELGGLH